MIERIDFETLHDLALRLSGSGSFRAEDIYVDLLLTSALPSIQSKFDFVLKGGTAITKAHLRPYRFSYDLDFSYFSTGNPRKHYRRYQENAEKFVLKLGFRIVNDESDRHREGGRIFVLKLMDDAAYLKIPIKLSVSSIDTKPCLEVVSKKFNMIVRIPPDPYSILYSEIYRKLESTNAAVLTIEELCAEKMRALATRGPKGEWSLILRDAVDLCVMDSMGILDRVLNTPAYVDCIVSKFSAIRNTNYWGKLKQFVATTPEITIGKEDVSIFTDAAILNGEKISKVIEKTRNSVKSIIQTIEKKYASKPEKV